MHKSLLIVLLSVSLIFPATLFGAEKPQVKETVALPDKPKSGDKLKETPKQTDMFDIVADKLDVYKSKGEAFFQGNVRATRQDMLVKSKTMRLFYDNTTKKLKQMTANGNVSIHMQDRDATCSQAIYLPIEDKLFLTGNVVISRGKDRATGQKAMIDMKNDVQSIVGEPGKQVHITGEATKGGIDFFGEQSPGSKTETKSETKQAPQSGQQPAAQPSPSGR